MTNVFLGIDLGTSSVKAVLLDEEGTEVQLAQVRYGLDRPAPQWAEQDPAVWWTATSEVIATVLARGTYDVLGIGLSGQMHGLVVVDGNGAALHPAIIWSDARSAAQVDEWRSIVGEHDVETSAGFPIAMGMLGVSLSWVRDMEPAVYERAEAVLLPKDYIRARLTGVLATEPTDAGGSLLYDIRAGRGATELMEKLGLRPELFPRVIPSLSIAGEVTDAAAAATGLAAGTPVAAGGGDQAMGALALGLDDPARAAIAVSSGGTVFKRTLAPLDPSLGLHVLPHAVAGNWMAMGVVLSAGLGIDWLAGSLFGSASSPERVTALMDAADSVPRGAEGLLFCANLGGTRTPVVDASARGSLVGLGFHHGQGHVTRAMVEGVSIALAQSLASMTGADEPVREIVISGGGARFRLWRQTLADVTGLPVRVSTDLEHSAIGAALAAAIAVGRPVQADFSTHVGETVSPDAAAVDFYRNLSLELTSVERALAHRKDPSS